MFAIIWLGGGDAVRQGRGFGAPPMRNRRLHQQKIQRIESHPRWVRRGKRGRTRSARSSSVVGCSGGCGGSPYPSWSGLFIDEGQSAGQAMRKEECKGQGSTRATSPAKPGARAGYSLHRCHQGWGASLFAERTPSPLGHPADVPLSAAKMRQEYESHRQEPPLCCNLVLWSRGLIGPMLSYQ